MKKYVIAAALILVASSSFAVIKGSKHDMSGTGLSSSYGNTSVNQICIYCHAPHNAKNSQLLWNRNNTTSTFTSYDKTVSGSLNYTTAAALHDTSKTCLGCHDGTIAIDEYGSVTGTSTRKITGTKKLGTDLRLSHPIGISYSEAAATDTGLTAYDASGQIGATTTKLQLFGTNKDQIECATCHDVHNKANQTSLLNMTNSASALCLNCHLK